MKKTLNKTLNLSKSTVACLNDHDLSKVYGGETVDCQTTEELTMQDCGKPILW